MVSSQIFVQSKEKSSMQKSLFRVIVEKEGGFPFKPCEIRAIQSTLLIICVIEKVVIGPFLSVKSMILVTEFPKAFWMT